MLLYVARVPGLYYIKAFRCRRAEIILGLWGTKRDVL